MSSKGKAPSRIFYSVLYSLCSSLYLAVRWVRVFGVYGGDKNSGARSDLTGCLSLRCRYSDLHGKLCFRTVRVRFPSRVIPLVYSIPVIVFFFLDNTFGRFILSSTGWIIFRTGDSISPSLCNTKILQTKTSTFYSQYLIYLSLRWRHCNETK